MRAKGKIPTVKLSSVKNISAPTESFLHGFMVILKVEFLKIRNEGEKEGNKIRGNT